MRVGLGLTKSELCVIILRAGFILNALELAVFTPIEGSPFRASRMRGWRGVILKDLGLVLELIEQLQLSVADAD